MPDLLCVALIVLSPVIDYFLVWRGFLRRSQVDPSRARISLFSSGVVELWILGRRGQTPRPCACSSLKIGHNAGMEIVIAGDNFHLLLFVQVLSGQVLLY